MKIYRSKYNFGRLEVGDTFKVAPLDFNSMTNSLRFHNKKHGKKMEVRAIDEEKNGEAIVSLIIKRVK